MARQYIVNSWVGACEYDEGDTYSGEQLGNRNQKSVEVKMQRSGDNWQANQPEVWVNGKPNIKAFAEPEAPKKTKKPVHITQQIIPQQKTLDRLDQQELALHKAYKQDETISLEEYEELLYALDQKRERAFKSLCKALGRQETCDSDYPVGQDGYGDETLNTYDKALTMGGFEANMHCIGSSFSKSTKKDTIYFLLASILGCSLLMYLTN